MDDPTRQRSKLGLEEHIKQLQARVQEAKLQATLASKDARDFLKPHVERLETELFTARARLRELGEASGDAFEEIQQGVSTAADAMKEAFRNAKVHLTGEHRTQRDRHE